MYLIKQYLNTPSILFLRSQITILYPLSLHDALPICRSPPPPSLEAPSLDLPGGVHDLVEHADVGSRLIVQDRKSTRLNSSHVSISYAVFCLKRKTFVRATL